MEQADKVQFRAGSCGFRLSPFASGSRSPSALSFRIMSRSLKRKAICGGAICLALVIWDVVVGLRRGWDIENLAKDTFLVSVVVGFIFYERRYYRKLASMPPEERDRWLADKLPEDREKILFKLKEYDA